jgi:hypothetical protein
MKSEYEMRDRLTSAFGVLRDLKRQYNDPWSYGKKDLINQIHEKIAEIEILEWVLGE